MKFSILGVSVCFALGLMATSANANPFEEAIETMMVDLTGKCSTTSHMSCVSVAPGGACSQQTNGVCVSHGPVDLKDLTKGVRCTCDTRPKPTPKPDEEQQSGN